MTRRRDRTPRNGHAETNGGANGAPAFGVGAIARLFTSSGGSHAPGSAPAAAAPPPPPAAAAAPPPPPPAPAPVPAAPPESPEATNANRWRQQQADRDAFTFTHQKQIPQGDISLPQVWLMLVRSRRMPASACTIWIRRVEPGPPYDFEVAGDAVEGQFPNRALVDYIERNRRQPQLHERFVGKIQGITQDGQIYDLGMGDLNLAPQLAPAQQPAWGAGAPAGAPPSWAGAWGGGAAAGAPPGGMPPWGPFGMMPPGFGSPFGYFAPPMQPPAPPPTTDPIALKMWGTMMESWTAMANRVMQVNPAAAAAPAAPPVDPFKTVDGVLNIAERLAGMRAPVQTSAGLTIHELKDGTPIVANGAGEVNQGLTEILIGKSMLGDAVKTIASRLRPGAVDAGAAAGASHAPMAPAK